MRGRLHAHGRVGGNVNTQILGRSVLTQPRSEAARGAEVIRPFALRKAASPLLTTDIAVSSGDASFDRNTGMISLRAGRRRAVLLDPDGTTGEPLGESLATVMGAGHVGVVIECEIDRVTVICMIAGESGKGAAPTWWRECLQASATRDQTAPQLSSRRDPGAFGNHFVNECVLIENYLQRIDLLWRPHWEAVPRYANPLRYKGAEQGSGAADGSTFRLPEATQWRPKQWRARCRLPGHRPGGRAGYRRRIARISPSCCGQRVTVNIAFSISR